MFWQLGNDTKEENSLVDAIYEDTANWPFASDGILVALQGWLQLNICP